MHWYYITEHQRGILSNVTEPDMANDTQPLFCRAGSATEEALIRGKITQTVEAIENAVGLKSAAHFMTMPAVLNK